MILLLKKKSNQVFSEAEVAAGHPVTTCEADAAAGANGSASKVGPTPPRSADEADAGAGEVKRPLKRARLGVIAPCLKNVGTGKMDGIFLVGMGEEKG